jgi:hypothetical protein
MYNFTKNDPELVATAKNMGIMPWWTSDNFGLSFFRPLTEITYRLDYLLWPDNPLLMHLQSLIWYILIIFLVSKLYRRKIKKTWMAGLAILLFAVTHTHAIPASWLANRHSLVAMFFGVLSILAHDRWRKDSWKAGFLLGPLYFIIGLLAGEFALAALAYLFAYMLFLDNETTGKRILSLMPYGVISLLWIFFYNIHGFGSSGSGIYIIPFSDPAAYFRALSERLPILLAGQWGIFIETIYLLLNKPVPLLIISAILLTLIVIVIVPILKRDKIARFWTLGMILSLLPVCVTFTGSRSLIFSNLGAMGLMAQIIGVWYEKENWLPSNILWKGAARFLIFLLIFIHLILSPIYTPVSIRGFKRFFEYHATSPASNLPVTPEVIGRDLILVNPPLTFLANQIIRYRNFKKLPNPANLRAFASSGYAPMEIKRTDMYTLKIKIKKGFYKQIFDLLVIDPGHFMKIGHKVRLQGHSIKIISLTEDNYPDKIELKFNNRITPNLLNVIKKNRIIMDGGDSDLQKTGIHTIEIKLNRISMENTYKTFRYRGKPIKKDQMIEYPSMTAEVLSLTEDLHPMEVAFRFSVPLESKQLKFLQWESGEYIPFELPKVGETVHLEKTSIFPKG